MGGDGLNSVQPLRYTVGAEYHSAHLTDKVNISS